MSPVHTRAALHVLDTWKPFLLPQGLPCPALQLTRTALLLSRSRAGSCPTSGMLQDEMLHADGSLAGA